MSAENKTESVSEVSAEPDSPKRYYFEDIEAHLDAELEKEKQMNKNKWRRLLEHMMRSGVPIKNKHIQVSNGKVTFFFGGDAYIDLSESEEGFYFDNGKGYSNHCSVDTIMRKMGLPPPAKEVPNLKQTKLNI